jgi:hypothetical protein
MTDAKKKIENSKTSYRSCPMARQLIFPMPEPVFKSLIKKISSSKSKSYLNVLIFKNSYCTSRPARKERATTTIEIDWNPYFLLICIGHSERTAT